MELIDGTSLETLPPELPRGLVAAAGASGVSRAGRWPRGLRMRGTIHRDIKPANILLRRDGTPVLVDFGLAAVADDKRLTQTGRSAGDTAMFAAPEQLRGKPADARSDIYSLAASLYRALVYNKPEHREPDQFEAEHVPELLRELLTAALHRKPERRPPSAAAFQEAWRRMDEWLQQKEEEERQRAVEERKRREEEEAEKRRQELLRRQEEAARRQAELEGLRQEGESRLQRLMVDVIDRTQGRPTEGDTSAANEICTRHGVSRDRAKQIVEDVRAQWERRKQDEVERLRVKGENILPRRGRFSQFPHRPAPLLLALAKSNARTWKRRSLSASRPLPARPAGEAVRQLEAGRPTIPVFPDPCRLVRQVKQFDGSR